MASIANITVKKADGTTDVVYNASVPSAGDKSPAVWTQNAASGTQALRPRFSMQTQSNAAQTIRQVKFALKFPVSYTDSGTGVEKQLAFASFDGTFFAPMSLTTTQWKEAFAQLGNLLCASAIRDSVETGYAPT